jgi:hypothetical protein
MKIKIGYDVIDNACHKLLEEIAGKDLEWNAEAWGEVRDTVESVLWDVYGIKLEFYDDSETKTIIHIKEEKHEDLGAGI